MIIDCTCLFMGSSWQKRMCVVFLVDSLFGMLAPERKKEDILTFLETGFYRQDLVTCTCME